MRPALLELRRILEGTTVYIVGGGSSLRGFDFKRLTGKNVIGINQACKYIEELTAIYWMDMDWAAKNYDTLERHKCKLRFCGRMQVPVGFESSDSKTLGGAIPLHITGRIGLDRDVNHVRGDNSGSHVINLAINCGVSRIVLLGFDLQPNHWHADYDLTYSQSVYDRFADAMYSIANVEHGVEILNASPCSALEAFPKVNLDELL